MREISRWQNQKVEELIENKIMEEENINKLCAFVVSLGGIKEVENFIKEFKFNRQEEIRFKFDLAILNIFLTTWVINQFFEENKAKKIIDPVFKKYMNLFVRAVPEIDKERFSQSQVKIGDFIKRELELKSYKQIIEVIIHKEVNIKDLRTDWRTLAGTLYNIRQAGYRQAIENQGSMGPIFSIAREFSRHFTGNENDEENGWLVVRLSLLFSVFATILTDFCKQNLD